MLQEITTTNRRLAKKRVKYLNEALCFVSSAVLVDSLVSRNPLLRQAPKRYRQWARAIYREKLDSIWLAYFTDRQALKNLTA